jgi:transcriptional regulator with XRE-family HTH domain
MATSSIKMLGRMTRPHKQPSSRTWLGRVARRIRELRINAGLSVHEARKTLASHGYDVTIQSIYKWERGVTAPTVEAFPAIAKTYRVQPGDILPSR